ncbi:MAG TPA: DUF4290 domain-containing protein [Brumimicrobium sp.]|nr:DUF4290 domain-containing protein [Brumimicrobium sp.]
MEEYTVGILSYNTEKPKLHIPEYGRNVQNMINYAKQLESREERNLAAQAIIDVMGQLNPHLRDIEDYNHKLWTHLFIMSDFQIDVDSPYDIPTSEKLQERPKLMKYPKNKARYGHFGYYSEQMIQEISGLKDEEEKDYFTEVIANVLKKDYLVFHTENVENSAIVSHLKEISKGKIKIEDTSIFKSTNAILKEMGMNAKPVVRKKTRSKKRRK